MLIFCSISRSACSPTSERSLDYVRTASSVHRNSHQPRIVGRHPVLSGIDGELPPISGYVLTTPKEHPLVEIAATAPLPPGQVNPLLASWTYGLGRSAVFTTDAGQRWAQPWTQWEKYDQLFVQLVRWSMRPIDNRGQFTVVSNGWPAIRPRRLTTNVWSGSRPAKTSAAAARFAPSEAATPPSWRPRSRRLPAPA